MLEPLHHQDVLSFNITLLSILTLLVCIIWYLTWGTFWAAAVDPKSWYMRVRAGILIGPRLWPTSVWVSVRFWCDPHILLAPSGCSRQAAWIQLEMLSLEYPVKHFIYFMFPTFSPLDWERVKSQFIHLGFWLTLCRSFFFFGNKFCPLATRILVDSFSS